MRKKKSTTRRRRLLLSSRSVSHGVFSLQSYHRRLSVVEIHMGKLSTSKQVYEK
ncbi:hypothetical protein F2Q70_00010607 [Brassica cretica]|uniref:Uncharacterized protein n=1 Tax=Brassica cretica TaxID=69181 RepID=A0A8S9LW26_BRACR|nr:hypothetical protein F2Q70_00010607 [Brassica cretica]